MQTDLHFTTGTCTERRLALRDAIDVLGGKWKLIILCSLMSGEQRFSDLEAKQPGISPKVLAKALQELEMNMLVTRTVHPGKPVTVTYQATEHAQAAWKVMNSLVEFGLVHRRSVKASAFKTV
ncbi:winged helix-turn-helix transcriptional regulator [Chitinophaga lutea]